MFYDGFHISAPGVVWIWKDNKYNDSEELSCDLMQFIGIKDKNGKEVYEGDIVEFEDGVRDSIVWNKEWQFHTMNNVDNSQEDFDNSEAVIIGNIYENPDLIC